MGHFWHNLAAALLISAAYVATFLGYRRWGPWGSVPDEGSRAGRFVRYRAGAPIWASVFFLLVLALYHLIRFDAWAFWSGFVIGSVADGAIDRRLHRPS